MNKYAVFWERSQKRLSNVAQVTVVNGKSKSDGHHAQERVAKEFSPEEPDVTIDTRRRSAIPKKIAEMRHLQVPLKSAIFRSVAIGPLAISKSVTATIQKC